MGRMTNFVFQGVVGDHLARSVRGIPCSPPAVPDHIR
jgi:hypothetical protein